MGGCRGVRGKRADREAALAFGDRRKALRPPDIDDEAGPLDVVFHQIDEVGPAGEDARGRSAAEGRDRGIGVAGPLISEGPHERAPSVPVAIAASIASTMLG